MQIGVHITYNHELQEKFMKTHRDPNYYFTVLLNAVSKGNVSISHKSYGCLKMPQPVLQKSDDIENVTMSKRQVFEQVKKYYAKNRYNLNCPDAAFYVTWSYFMESEKDEASWLDTAKRGGLCEDDGVGMFYDDGETFLGAHALSRELAFLIGATRDNLTYGDCSKKLGYLTSRLDDTTSFRLSRCARANITRYFLSNQQKSCWNDAPAAVIPNNWTLPSGYLEEALINGSIDLCTSHLFYINDVRSCSVSDTSH
ncbi:unnamed protein product, partial [Ixodes hexagonus]